MIVIGLTGSIGMGKSTVASMFAARGIPVFDADAAVRDLYRAGGRAVAAVGARFPGTVRDGAIDREALSRAVLDDTEALAELEALVHPLVREAEEAFLASAETAGARCAVVEIPLLFETGGDRRVDVAVVVSAPADIQRSRVLSRPGMSAEKLDAILARQVPDGEKRRRADFVISTGQSLAATEAEVAELIDNLRSRKDNGEGRRA